MSIEAGIQIAWMWKFEDKEKLLLMTGVGLAYKQQLEQKEMRVTCTGMVQKKYVRVSYPRKKKQSLVILCAVLVWNRAKYAEIPLILADVLNG